MREDELLYVMALCRLFPYSLRTVKGLLGLYTHPQEAYERAQAEHKSQTLDEAKKELEFIHQHDIATYYYRDSSYPYRLAQCPDAPVLLFGKGNMELNQGHMVSVVGTRNPSPRGCELCSKLVRDLAQRMPDITIISGLAYGIDITAHRAAIQADIPTLIIPGHGLDRIYPVTHRREAVAALHKGGILTEYPSGTEPLAPHFVARNRIIAGLADAVVVVESKAKGGSLITARIAQDYNRDIYTFPGRVDDICSVGCNQLIKSHQAQLIESADDLILSMNWPTVDHPVQTELSLSSELTDSQQQLLHLLRESSDGIHCNLLVIETGLDYSTVSSDLMMLELQDLVRSLPGGIWMARK